MLTARVLIALWKIAAATVCILAALILFAPTGVPLQVFANTTQPMPARPVLALAKAEDLAVHAVRLAVVETVEPKGPKVPPLVALLIEWRGRLFSGEDQMLAYALERSSVRPGVMGLAEAAPKCFNKSPEELTLAEAAVVLIHMRSPSRRWSGEQEELLQQRNALLGRLVARDGLPEAEIADAVSEPLVFCG